MTTSETQIAIRHEETETKGRFFTDAVDGNVAEMTFTKAGEGLLIIDHTEVPGAFSGMGIGVRLVEQGVEHARATGRKVVPLCPYAAHQFRKHPEWHDTLNR